MDIKLCELVCQTCEHPSGSTKRGQGFNRLIRAILQSGKLWRENSLYYEDALQQTWLYLYRNLCEGESRYQPDRSSLTTWLNGYLKRRLQDFQIRDWQEQNFIVPHPFPYTENSTDPIANLPAPPDIPDILKETQIWVETDPDGELRSIHIKGRSDLTCQLLILRRLPPETAWATLAAELNCPVSTLANFYQRQCLPRLRKFAESQGYL
ncbi:MAG TPA: hypothetical protein DDZ80_22085 [Cyanobacteria bacterium UBA8803]|nr:hypothetical protein [Cyanobacteria bacterium UBA9273]HBL61021.1 hypothetical protein [Cyanobacteria bacterium UBA8803]